MKSKQKRHQNARILIVDDLPKNIQVLGTILKREGYRINVARNGLEALDVAGKVPLDLILLDVMMPRMDGWETCEKLKQSPETKDIPIVFLTARTDTEAIVRGFNAGGVDYVSKPFNTSELLARIHTHIDLWQKTRQLRDLAENDGLTMIANRRRFDTFLELEWRRCMRTDNPLSLILIDIDYFKAYNDSYGHQRGDECLKQVAEAIRQTAKRPGDLAARYGGEEFILVLGNTDAKSAIKLAEATRLRIEQLGIPHVTSMVNDTITVSMGVATVIPDKDMAPAGLIEIADGLLYESKHAGRNQVKWNFCEESPHD